MNEPTRRGFLAVTGAGAATVAAVAVAGSAHGADSTPQAEPTADLPSAGTGPLVAYLTDVSSGRITFVTGEEKAVVTDQALAATLLRRAGRG